MVEYGDNINPNIGGLNRRTFLLIPFALLSLKVTDRIVSPDPLATKDTGDYSDLGQKLGALAGCGLGAWGATVDNRGEEGGPDVDKANIIVWSLGGAAAGALTGNTIGKHISR